MPLLRKQALPLMERSLFGAGLGSAGDAQPQAPAQMTSPQQPGGFINLQDYLTANRDSAKAMAGQLLDPLEQKGEALTAGTSGLEGQAEIDAAEDVQRKTGLLGTSGGQEELINQQYGSGGQYSQGERNLDLALLGGVAGDRMSQLSSKYSGLSGMVRGRQQQAAVRPLATVDSAAPSPDSAVQTEAKKEAQQEAAGSDAARAKRRHQEDERKKRESRSQPVY